MEKEIKLFQRKLHKRLTAVTDWVDQVYTAMVDGLERIPVSELHSNKKYASLGKRMLH